MGYSSEKNKEYLRERYAQQRADFIAFLGGECAKCGSTDDLEFDHIDRSTKSFGIAGLWPVKRLPEVYEELKKCQLLCDPCHNEKSLDELTADPPRQGFKHGTIYGWMTKKCQCEECIAAKWLWHDERNAKRRQPSGRGPRPRHR